METVNSVDQRRQVVGAFVALHHDDLVRQGAVISTWRRRGSRKLGPYYLLVCRDRQGRQRSVYLGPAGTLVDEIRTMLSSLQQPSVQSRVLRKARRQIRSALSKSWQELSVQLASVGLKRRGTHISGISACRLAAELTDD